MVDRSINLQYDVFKTFLSVQYSRGRAFEKLKIEYYACTVRKQFFFPFDRIKCGLIAFE